MENATKALLIAAAILIAIVVITLGVFVLGKGSTLVKDNSDMSDVEVSTYNSKFEAYFGTNVRGAQVRQLVNAVNQHNKANEDDPSKTVKLKGVKGEGATEAPNFDDKTIQTGKTYKITATGHTSGGLISEITIQEKK